MQKSSATRPRATSLTYGNGRLRVIADLSASGYALTMCSGASRPNHVYLLLHNHEPNSPWLLHGGLMETPQLFLNRDAAIAYALRDARTNRCVIREEAAPPDGLRLIEPQSTEENRGNLQ